jgi:hypothetical protein
MHPVCKRGILGLCSYPSYLEDRLIRPHPDSMGIDPEFPPHEIRCEALLALFDSIDVELVSPKVTRAHQLGTRIARNFGPHKVRSASSASPSSSHVEEYLIINVIMLQFIWFGPGWPAIGTEDLP